MTGLPAGIYLAIAREAIADGEWESKEFLAGASKDATRVALTSGSAAEVTLRIAK